MTALAALVEEVLGIAVDPASAQRVNGGSVSQAWRLRSADGWVFVKVGDQSQAAMFAAEAQGLGELRSADAVRVPDVLAVSSSSRGACIVLEWLELRTQDSRSDELLGSQLAAQHRVSRQRFGWDRDNSIGITQQRNPWREDWVDFLREQRIGFQLDLAAGDRSTAADSRLIARGRLLCASLHEFFSGYQPVPSLLHGDLWSGNCSTTTSGQPVIFDPAVYFGDREADLAMTRLFGGFSPRFYAAYAAAWPMDVGAPVRAELYNLYHVLNHLNMFGGAYRSQARSMIDRLLAEVGK